MEEGEAAPVGSAAPGAQIVPALDLVHGLVADDPLEDVGRRRPVDVAQHQEAAVEPRAETDGRSRRRRSRAAGPRRRASGDPGASDESRGAAGCEVEAPEQLLARRLDGSQERLEVWRGRRLVVGGPRRCRSRSWSGSKSLASRRKNSSRAATRRARRRGRAPGGRAPRPMPRRGRRGASRQRPSRVSGLLLGIRPRARPAPRPGARRPLDQGSPALGDAAQQILEEARVHRRYSLRRWSGRACARPRGAGITRS